MIATEDQTAHTGRTMSPGAKRAARAVTGLHNTLYRLSGGRVGGSLLGRPVLLLSVEGRKTGKRRTSPLLYLADGENLVIVASVGGAAHHPTWWLNLRAHPEAEVQVGRRKLGVRAREAVGEEKARLWTRLVEMYPGYAEYQRRTSREIPVIVLTPADGRPE